MREDNKTPVERIQWLDILRGFGIVFVVLGHVYQNDEAYRWIYSFHIPLFFFAGGWVYRKRDILQDLKKRFMTIIVPYFSFGLLTLLYWQVFERKFRPFTDISFGKSLYGLLSGNYDYLEFNKHLWFLPSFFIAAVFYNMLMNVPDWNNGTKVRTAIRVTLAAASMLEVCFPLPELPFGLNRMFRYIGFYAVGNSLADKARGLLPGKKEKAWLGAGILVFLPLHYFCVQRKLNSGGVIWFLTAMLGISAWAAVSALLGHNRVLQYLGRGSMFILCMHGPVYRILSKVCAVFWGSTTDKVRGNICFAMIITTQTLLVCVCLYQMIKKISQALHLAQISRRL